MWNMVGRAGPVIIAVLVTPALVEALGYERWGLFTIALTLIGTFGIFDFGLGRAITRAVAEHVGAGEEGQAASLVLTGLLTMFGLGLCGGLAAAIVSGYWLQHGLLISASRQHEVLISLYVFCVSAPFVVLNGAMWGVLAAYQRFRTANLVNIPITAMYYIGPLLALHIWNSLIGVMCVLLACRLAMTLAYAVICFDCMPRLRSARPAFALLLPLIRIGGWMTVSNLIFPALLYIDRFMIASILSATETGYYSTPSDIVARFSIVSIAVMGTAFPAMASSYRVDPGNTVAVFRHSIMAIGALVFPLSLCVTGLSGPIMTLWLGADFARHAAPVLCWLGIGAMFAAVDGVVAGLIDCIGRPDVNAKFSILELFLYVPLLMLLLSRVGIEGAAVAWALRAALDFVVRAAIVGRLYAPVAGKMGRIATTVFASGLLVAAPVLGQDIPTQGILMAVALVLFMALMWFRSLLPPERTHIVGWSAGAIAGVGAAMKWR